MQQAAIQKGDRRLAITRRMQTPIEQAPTPSQRIIRFQAGQRAGRSANPTCHQNCPIREQVRGMQEARRIEVAGPRPETGGGIIDFRTGGTSAPVIVSTRDEHPPISQEGLGMIKSGHVETAGVGPDSRRRIVQLSRGNRTAASVAPAISNFAAGERSEVASGSSLVGIPVALQVPLAESYNFALAVAEEFEMPPATSTLAFGSRSE
jgi:hypothetical protein